MTYIMAADLAALWCVPVAEVYRRANRAQWRRTRTKPIGYLLADVMADDGTCRLVRR